MERSEKINLLLNLIEQTNKYTKLYDLGTPAIPDQEYDNIYFKIVELERELDIYPRNSPTQRIPFDVVSSLKKVKHNHKMLSLQKTKELNEVEKFLGKESYLAMCKMDGLTCSLTYENGILVRAETRGNGLIGEDILHNIKHLKSVPLYIPYKDTLIVDGEIICTYNNFEIFASEYKNPRNFAAGSIRLLDSSECANRKLTFVAWDVIEGFIDVKFLSEKLRYLQRNGFIIVPKIKGSNDINVELDMLVSHLIEDAKDLEYPIDGIVFKFDNIEYGKSLGATDHHLRNAIAYKFYDETYMTTLRDIEWSMGRTGQISPVAIFDEVDIDGSSVSRASLHNLDILEATLHGCGWEGQKIEVFKANMIIPQIKWAENDDGKDKHYFNYPAVCPVCGRATRVRADGTSRFLVCDNSECKGQLINRLDHFCSKQGLDIKGLSKATLSKLIEWGWVDSFYDIFNLKKFANDWKIQPGFGEKSVDKILSAIDDGAHCDLHQFIAALGIPLIGTVASKQLAETFKTWDNFMMAIESKYEFYNLPNFGPEMHYAIMHFNYKEAMDLVADCITFNSITENVKEFTLDGMTFAISGKLNYFKNRDAIKNKIESLGGKVVGSVSKNTNYLINNDKNSASAKNKNAQSLGIPILSEEDFIETFGIE